MKNTSKSVILMYLIMCFYTLKLNFMLWKPDERVFFIFMSFLFTFLIHFFEQIKKLKD